MILDLLYLIFSPLMFFWNCFIETKSIIFLILGISMLCNWKKQ